MVELKDFVRDSILQIVAGIAEAQAAVDEYGASVNPPPANNPREGAVRYIAEGADGKNVPAFVQDFEFDVALTARDATTDGATVAVLAGLIGGGVSAKSEEGHESVSRLKFKIPVGLPIGAGVQPMRKKPRVVAKFRAEH